VIVSFVYLEFTRSLAHFWTLSSKIKRENSD